MADHQQVKRRRPRTFHEHKNILGIYDDAELTKRYRLDSECIAFVTNLVRDKLHSLIEYKVLKTLRYLATGKMQLCKTASLIQFSLLLSVVVAKDIYYK